jgi:hypothetical protein
MPVDNFDKAVSLVLRRHCTSLWVRRGRFRVPSLRGLFNKHVVCLRKETFQWLLVTLVVPVIYLLGGHFFTWPAVMFTVGSLVALVRDREARRRLRFELRWRCQQIDCPLDAPAAEIVRRIDDSDSEYIQWVLRSLGYV